MKQLSFNRHVKIRVYATTSSSEDSVPTISYTNGYTEFSSLQDDGSPGYRIKGKVIIQQQTISFGSNPIFVAIYNLGKNSRAIVESSIGTNIEIYAGYGDAPKIIGVGNILWAKTHKEHSDYITQIQIGDGHFGLVNGVINTNFKGAVTYRQVVSALMNALSGTGIIAGTLNIPDGGFNNGIVLARSPLKALSEICPKMGCQLLFQANTLNIVPVGTDLGHPAIDISTDLGMVGIPEIHPPGEIGIIKTAESASVQNNLSIKMLMRPEIGIGQELNISSAFVNGLYVTGRVVHDFDSWDGPFYTECECFLANKSKANG